MAIETIISEIRRVHRSIALYPVGYLEENGYSLKAMSNIYDKNNNPTGVGLLVYCALMDDYDITHSPETNDDLRACDVTVNSVLTGVTYDISGTTRRDFNLTNYSSNNLLFAATMKPDIRWELLDFFGAADSEDVLPENPFTNGVRWQLYEFSTDVFRDIIENGSMAAAEVALLSRGKIIKSRSLISDADPIALTYSEPTEFVANENFDVLIGLTPDALSNYDNPDINELNDPEKFVNAVGVIYFDGSTFPHAAESDSNSFPVMNQNANSETRGAQNAEMGLQLALPKNIEDRTSAQGRLFNTFDLKPNEELPLPVVTRIAQSPATQRGEIKAGDLVSAYRFKFRIPHNNSDGDNPYFIDTEGSLAGLMNVNVFAVDGTTPLTIAKDSNWDDLPQAVGTTISLHTSINGIDTSYAAEYSSSDRTVATVDSTGFVRAVGEGTYTITAHVDGATDVVSDLITVGFPATPTITTEPPLSLGYGGVFNVIGTNLQTVYKITVDGIVVDEFAKIGGTELKFLVPMHEAGTVDVVFDNYSGTPVTIEGTYP
jgi:hypothetical protein